MTNDLNIMQHKLTNDPKIMQNKATNFKITGPMGIFGENRDIKRSPGNNLLTIFSPYVKTVKCQFYALTATADFI